MNIELILNNLKKHLGLKTDRELSIELGVSQSSISQWRSKGTMDYPLVFDKCTDIDLNWLVRGEELKKEKGDEDLKVWEYPIKYEGMGRRIKELFGDIEETNGVQMTDFAVKVGISPEHFKRIVNEEEIPNEKLAKFIANRAYDLYGLNKNYILNDIHDIGYLIDLEHAELLPDHKIEPMFYKPEEEEKQVKKKQKK